MDRFSQKLFFAYHSENGQVILLVVLLLVIAMTVGLSVATRNIVQLKTSLEDTDTQKAFSAAEAGIQEALQTNNNITGEKLGNNATISSVNVVQVQSDTLLLNNGIPLHRDEGTDVWLSTYPNYTAPLSGKITFYWGTGTVPCNEAALEIMLISSPTGTPVITQSVVDHNDCSLRATQNNFTNASAGGTIAGQTFKYSTTITYTNGSFARVISLYNDAIVGVKNTTNAGAPLSLPIQGQLITATGVSGDATRKLTYFQTYEGVPSEFFYTLFQTQ